MLAGRKRERAPGLVQAMSERQLVGSALPRGSSPRLRAERRAQAIQRGAANARQKAVENEILKEVLEVMKWRKRLARSPLWPREGL